MQIEMVVTKIRLFIKIKVVKSLILFARLQICVSRFWCLLARADNGRHNVFLLQSVGTMQIEMSVTKLRRFIKIKVSKSLRLFAHFQIRVSRF